MSEEHPSDLQPKKAKTLIESLWFPALFFVGFIVCYMIPFHAPEPHGLKVAVSGPVAAAQIEAGLEGKTPGAFEVISVKDADAAREQVEDRKALAAYSVGRDDHATLYLAKGNGMMIESTVTSVFAPLAEGQGYELKTVDLAPIAKGDVTGTSLFYLAMVWNIVPYIAVMMLMRATSLSRREKLTTIAVVGAVVSAVGYAVALGLDIVPNEPLAMLYGFILTQAVGLTVFGLVPFVRQYIPGVAITLFVLLSIPSSGGAIPYQMVPGFFRWLHPVMPLGNFIDAMHGLFYFDGKGMLRPTVVLLAWLAAGVALTAFGALRQARKAKALAAGGAGSTVVEAEEEEVIEDPSIEAPLPHSVKPGSAHGEVPMLQGQVTGFDGMPVAQAMITVTDGRGRRLMSSHSDAGGWYAMTGLPETFVNVLLTAPNRLPAVARVLPDSGHPQRWDFVLEDGRQVRSASATPSPH
ncbi:hypothetical protein ABZ454_05235 [Streptomyces sp. NPDC005803]|uniref:hypothetical protein n=1 Tax=Streptomyces sp. NPDC005803 TaxID=3154297 RepID=UPI0033D62BD3